jgi:hypothetical protein
MMRNKNKNKNKIKSRYTDDNHMIVVRLAPKRPLARFAFGLTGEQQPLIGARCSTELLGFVSVQVRKDISNLVHASD